MSEEEDWVKSASCDDSMVAELLIRLRESMTHPKRRPPPLRLLEWGATQPRSRQILRYDVDVVAQSMKKKGELTRASPTTPLSWSAGTSNSGGGAGDGYEECSVRPSNARSKVIFPSEINIKRSRKKKTFVQLKEQESMLLREGIHLKRALASEHMIYEKEKSRNESLKRLKLDLHLEPTIQPGTSNDAWKKPSVNQSYQANAMPINQASTQFPASGKYELDPVLCRSVPASECSEAQKNESMRHECLPVVPDLNLLPDLNLPFEEDLN